MISVDNFTAGLIMLALGFSTGVALVEFFWLVQS